MLLWATRREMWERGQIPAGCRNAGAGAGGPACPGSGRAACQALLMARHGNSAVSENSTVMELNMELSQRLINLEFKIEMILRKLDQKPDRADLAGLTRS